MRWQLAKPDRTASGSSEDWDLCIDDEELEVAGFVSKLKDGWRALAFVGNGPVSMHLTIEEAKDAVVAELVTWRMSK